MLDQRDVTQSHFGDLCAHKVMPSQLKANFSIKPNSLYCNSTNNHYIVISEKAKISRVYSNLPSKLVLCFIFWNRRLLRKFHCVAARAVELKFHYVIALRPTWMSMCVPEVGERRRRMQWILMQSEKEPWRKPICYLYQASLHGAKLPLTVMHCKWLISAILRDCLS